MKKLFVILVVGMLFLFSGCGKKDVSTIVNDNNVDAIAWEEVEARWKYTLVMELLSYLGVNSGIYSMNTTFSVTDIDNSGIPEIIINGDFKQAIITFNRGNPEVQELYWPFITYEQEHGFFVQRGVESGREDCVIYKVDNDVLTEEKRLSCYFEEIEDENNEIVLTNDIYWEIDYKEVSKEEYETCLKSYYNPESAIAVADFAIPTYVMLERVIVNFEDYTLSYKEINYEVEGWKKEYKEKMDAYLDEYDWKRGDTIGVNYMLTDYDKSGIPEIVVWDMYYDEYLLFTFKQECTLEEVVVGKEIFYDYDNNILIVVKNDSMMSSYYKVDNDQLLLISNEKEMESNFVFASLKRDNPFLGARACVSKYILADAINRY